MLTCISVDVDDTATSAIVTLESDKEGASAFEELQSVSAKNLALSKAAGEGLSSPGLSEMGTPAPFGVRKDGKPIEGSTDEVDKWRISYRTTRRLI